MYSLQHGNEHRHKTCHFTHTLTHTHTHTFKSIASSNIFTALHSKSNSIVKLQGKTEIPKLRLVNVKELISSNHQMLRL